jgi:hypothetical protein
MELILGVVGFLIVFSNLNDGDNKVVVAGSSVYHIGLSIVCINIIWLLRYSHMLISPLIFLRVYMRYLSSGSRNKSVLGMGLLVVNLGFPLVGSFFGEVYIITTVISMVIYCYYFVGVVYLVKLASVENNMGYLLVVVPYFKIV